MGAALEFGFDFFLTFSDRQWKMANTAGLSVKI